jgi:hypothetical protein
MAGAHRAEREDRQEERESHEQASERGAHPLPLRCGRVEDHGESGGGESQLVRNARGSQIEETRHARDRYRANFNDAHSQTPGSGTSQMSCVLPSNSV